MGTVNSISKDINNTVDESQDESSEYEFKKINSIKDNNSKYLSQGQTESTFNTKNETNEDKIPFKFEWIEGGSEVFITGTFMDNWKTFKKMEKNSSTGIFEVIIYISKDIHQFKFIIDNIWKCSRNYKIVYEISHNKNNIIDLRRYTYSKSNKKVKKIAHIKNIIEYNCIIPNSNEMNTDAPNVPTNYISHFNLNFWTKKEFLKNNFKTPVSLNKKKMIIENDTFKTIMAVSNEKLSHLFSNNKKNINNEKYIRSAVTQRNKQKYITIVYFTPKK